MQETFADILVELGNRVPNDIDLLYHLCYGDSGHKHVVEPTDMNDMVEFANRLAQRIARPVQLVHMPVPRNRSDDAYFAPLKRLKLRPETATVPRPRAPHRRRRRHRAASGDGQATSTESCAKLFRLPPNAASAGAIRRPYRSCFASTPLSPTPSDLHKLIRIPREGMNIDAELITLGALGALATALAGICGSAQADPIKIRAAYVVPVANWASLLGGEEGPRQALGHILRLRGGALSGHAADDHGAGGRMSWRSPISLTRRWGSPSRTPASTICR